MYTKLKSEKKRGLERSSDFYTSKVKRKAMSKPFVTISPLSLIPLKGKSIDEFAIKRIIRELKQEISKKKIHPFLERYPTFELYRSRVLTETNRQPIELLGDISKRSWKDWNIDHIVSIKFGYRNKIPHQIIGNIKNLQLIPHIENSTKGTKCYCILEYSQHLKTL